MKNYLIYLIYFFLLTIIVFKKIPLIKSINYNQDEADYVANSLLWSEYKINYSSQVWSLPWAYDQPHLYHFLIGYLFHDKLTPTLKNNFSQRFPGEGQYAVSWNREYGGNYYGTPDPKYHFITDVRQVSFVLYVLIFLLIGIISLYIIGKVGLFFSLLVLVLNQNLDSTLITAVSDGLLLLFILLSILFWIICLKKETAFRSPNLILQSILTGLAVSTKLNGGILLLFFNMILVFNLSAKSIYQKTKIIIIANIIPFLIFFSLNPYLWKNTIKRTFQMFTYRLTLNSVIPFFFPNDCPPNKYLIDKIYFNSQHLLNFQNPTIISATIFLVVILSSLYTVLFTGTSLFKKNILLIMIMLQIVTLSYISVYWSRYYIPSQIGLYLNTLTLFSILFDYLSINSKILSIFHLHRKIRKLYAQNNYKL